MWQFFKNLSTGDFKEFMGTLILACVMTYLLLPTSYTDASIRGAMLTTLGIIVKHYFPGGKSS